MKLVMVFMDISYFAINFFLPTSNELQMNVGSY